MEELEILKETLEKEKQKNKRLTLQVADLNEEYKILNGKYEHLQADKVSLRKQNLETGFKL